MIKLLLITVSSLFFMACTSSSLTPVSNSKTSNYTGKATILIAVEGTDDRKVRHIVIITKEEPEGYEIYFHKNKVNQGFIAITLPTPSTYIHLSEYSLTGMYGCSRGKSGYGYGDTIIPKISQGKSYFLGTINTGMNTTYKKMPKELIKEAKNKYNYIVHGTDIERNTMFKSHIKL